MQKTLPILGLFAILFVGLITPAVAEYDNKWDEKYKELEEEFEEKRHHLEREFHEEFEELEREYEEKKMEIYEKIEESPDLKDSEINKLFDELYLDFEEKRLALEHDMMKQFEEIDELFEKELRHIDEEAKEYYEKHDDRYEDDDYYYDDDYFEHDDYKDYDEPHKYDPEWKSIEPLAQRIMDVIPMEKIQSLWESGQIDRLIELITSETDLSYEEAKHVVMFFEKYGDKEHDRYDYPEHDYPEPYPAPYVDDGEVLRLEQRIAELEEENQILRDTIAELEEKISQINAVVMEQVKFIYEWVLSQ